MPADGPDDARPSGPPGPNEHRLLALGKAIERGPRRRPGSPPRGGRRRRRGLLRNVGRGGRIAIFAGAGLTALVALVVLALFIDYLYLSGLAHKKPVGSEQSATGRSENILLVGSTNRCAPGMKPNPAYGLCTNGVTGVNSDIVMIVHLDANTHTAGLLSIPRDTFIPNARKEGANKIDAALYETPTQLVTAIEEDFGIPIDHFVELNFDTFASVVDIVGGVNMYFPMRVYDAESGLNIEHAGCYHLDGIHALQVVRARHLQIGWYRVGTFVAPQATGTHTPFYFGTDPHTWP
ncbi:MAG TPA: LCP family protein, partial [Acidimicrobiales bacterium]|nr:LCP family protein [Acidimicrobiales bacterium]